MEKKNHIIKKIDTQVDLQVSILLSIFVAIITLTCFTVSYHITYDDMKYSLKERVQIIYEYLEDQLDMTDFSDFEAREDMESPDYDVIHDVLKSVKESTGLMYLYTAKKTEAGRYVYVIDGLSPENEDFRYPGDPIEEEIFEDMDRALGGEEVYPDDIVHTSWGDIFICYLPLYDAGEIIGVLGIEFEASHQYLTYQKLKWFVPAAVVLFTILAFTISRAMFRHVNIVMEREKEQRRIVEEALQRAEAASKAKTSFLFNISHDIRTPMNAIVGFTRIAREHRDDRERLDDSLEKLDYAGRHLRRLINDVLDMARIEKGNLEIHPEPCSLRDSVEAAEKLIRSEMEAKGLTFEVKLENIEYDRVICDSVRLEQIALHLLTNALRYTNPGGMVAYHVSQKGEDGQGNVNVEMSIRDTGVGMTEEFQHHVFGIFEREKSATESGVDGVGLGLAITRQLVELHGGTIELESQKDHGTEFIIRLKLKIAEESRSSESEKETCAKLPCFDGKRVLLVEDNPLNQEIAETLLVEIGFEVECAQDGEEAVEMVAHSVPGHYDLVLMDIQMPRLDGYEAAREIRKLRDPGLSRLPIIALTANAFEEDKIKAFDCGMDGHIAKPFDVEELTDILAKVVGLKRRGQESE